MIVSGSMKFPCSSSSTILLVGKIPHFNLDIGSVKKDMVWGIVKKIILKKLLKQNFKLLWKGNI